MHDSDTELGQLEAVLTSHATYMPAISSSCVVFSFRIYAVGGRAGEGTGNIVVQAGILLVVVPTTTASLVLRSRWNY